MTLNKTNWFNILFAFAILAGVLIAHLSFVNIVEPNNPYMIVDKNVPSDYCPVGYEPVEITGLPVSQGERAMLNCQVPESYAQYVHYPDNWETNVMNPQSAQGGFAKWGLYGVLALVLIYIIWKFVSIVRKKNKIKEIKNNGENQ